MALLDYPRDLTQAGAAALDVLPLTLAGELVDAGEQVLGLCRGHCNISGGRRQDLDVLQQVNHVGAHSVV